MKRRFSGAPYWVLHLREEKNPCGRWVCPQFLEVAAEIGARARVRARVRAREKRARARAISEIVTKPV